MTTTSPPEVLVLDVNETLSDLEPMRERFQQVGLPRHALDVWFAATLRDGFALTTARAYASFRDVAGDALRALLTLEGIDEADIPEQSSTSSRVSRGSRRIPTSRQGCTGSTLPASS